MTYLGLWWSPGALWLAMGLALAIAELIAPGVFLVFMAAGAALTGACVLFIPGMPVLLQAILFGLFSTAAVAIGRRWYGERPVPTSDPLLNDRAARLIGSTVEVCEPIIGGEGRVRVGDGAWTAQGPDTTVGARVRIIGATGSVLLVEPA